jgi:hypothetical protein
MLEISFKKKKKKKNILNDKVELLRANEERSFLFLILFF